MTNGQTQGDQGAQGAQGHPDAGWSLWRPQVGRWSELDAQNFYYRAAADTPETGFYVGGLLPYQGYDRRADIYVGGGFVSGSEKERRQSAAGRIVGDRTADGAGTILDAGDRFARPRYVSSGLEPEPDDQVTDEHGNLVPADRVRIVRAAIALIRIAGWLGGGGTPIMTARGATVLVGGWRAVRALELLRASGELGADEPLPNRLSPPVGQQSDTPPVWGTNIFTAADAFARAGLPAPNPDDLRPAE